METWEDMGMTREAYDEAIRQMGEDLGVDAPPSDEDMMGMHIQHVLDDVIPEGQRNGFTTETWDDVALAIEEGDILQMQDVPQTSDLVDRLAAFVHESGYNPRAYAAGSVHDWADRRGREIAAREGKAWPVPHDTAMDQPEIASVHDAAFDEMLNVCLDSNQPWTKALHKEMNDKILSEAEALAVDYSHACQETDTRREQIAVIADLRERDGINGDEPNLPAYEAERYMYGTPAEELMADADSRQEEAERVYDEGLRGLFERVYQYGNRDFDALPDTVRGNLYESDFQVSQDTYAVLSDTGYDAFYRETLQAYAKAKQAEYRGVDFSKSAKSMPSPVERAMTRDFDNKAPKVPEKSEKSARQTARAKSYAAYKYEPKFADDRQHDDAGDFGNN